MLFSHGNQPAVATIAAAAAREGCKALWEILQGEDLPSSSKTVLSPSNTHIRSSSITGANMKRADSRPQGHGSNVRRCMELNEKKLDPRRESHVERCSQECWGIIIRSGRNVFTYHFMHVGRKKEKKLKKGNNQICHCSQTHHNNSYAAQGCRADPSPSGWLQQTSTHASQLPLQLAETSMAS